MNTIRFFSLFIIINFFAIYSISANSIFITDHSVITPVLGKIPQKGETRIDPSTGFKITRMTDASEFSGSSDALIVYSRYSPENSNGKYILVFGSNSTSSWVVERATGQIVSRLRSDAKHDIGERHEVRWDNSGKHPNRIYFVKNMRFYMIDDVINQHRSRKMIKDFTNHVPSATKIYNDVEGDSSNDSDHWVWMAVHYDGKTNIVDAFIHFQISTGKTNILVPADLAGTNLSHYAKSDHFPRPNMVEVSPLASGLVLHYGRAWGTEEYGERVADIGSWFDGAYLWPLDFNFKKKTPIKISIGQTHSGWSIDEHENEYFISQNNRTDKIDAVKLSGEKSGFENRLEIASHEDFGWSNGFHFGKMNALRKGWVFLSTYAKNKKPKLQNEDWGNNQLVFLPLKSQSNKVLRIGSNYNVYTGNYRDEAPAAINLLGNRIYLSSNWGGMLDHREVFLIELSDDWNEQ